MSVFFCVGVIKVRGHEFESAQKDDHSILIKNCKLYLFKDLPSC